LVTFDANTAIATDQVDDEDPSQGVDPGKQALVTIDSRPPTSSVAALPAYSPPSFTVNWNGQDDPGGAGLARFSIFVSDNGGAFTPWLTNPTLTPAPYTGVNGHTYGFLSIATDNVGNVEATPTGAEATTTVSPATATMVQSSANPSVYGQLIT